MIGKILLAWMVDNDRTPIYLAQQAGVHTDALVSIITGEVAATDQEVAGLAQAAGVPEGELRRAAEQAPDPGYRDPLQCFTVKEAARILGVSEDLVRAEMRAGLIEYVIIGERAYRIPRYALENRLLMVRGSDSGKITDRRPPIPEPARTPTSPPSEALVSPAKSPAQSAATDDDDHTERRLF